MAKLSETLKQYYHHHTSKVLDTFVSLQLSHLDTALHIIYKLKEVCEEQVNGRNIDLYKSCKEELSVPFTNLNDCENEEKALDQIKQIFEDSEFQRVVIAPQDQARFTYLKNDSFRIKCFKTFKKPAFWITRFPARVANLWRKLRKQDPKPFTYWKHKVDLASVYEVEIYPLLGYELIKQVDATRLEIASIISKIFIHFGEEQTNIRESILAVLQQAINQLEALKTKVQETTFSAPDQFLPLFEDRCQKAGTLEEHYWKYWKHIRSKSGKTIRKGLLKDGANWSNTFYALFEDWRMRVYFLFFLARMKNAHERLEHILSEKSSEKIAPLIVKIEAYVSNLKAPLDEIKTEKALKSQLIKDRHLINKSLSKDVSEFVDTLVNQEFPGLIDKLEHDVSQLTNDLPEKIGLVKTANYERKIESSEISHFSPHQVMMYKSLPDFVDKVQSVKRLVGVEIQNIYKDSQDFHHTLDFCYDSGIESFEEDGTDLDETREVIQEGLARSIEKINKIESEFREAMSSFSEQINMAVDDLAESILLLEQNENVYNIKLKITQARTIQNSRQIKKRFIDGFLKVFINLKQYFLKGWRQVKKGRLWFYENIFLSKDKEEITSEISNFLAESQQLTANLPIVYRRLYEPKPVEEQNIFYGRKNELKLLTKSLENWEDGHVSSALLTGEKGSGITSLMQMFLSGIKRKRSVITYSCPGIFYTDKHFEEFKKEVGLSQESESSQDKKIIVIDGLERFYLRKLRGFECLKKLFELIIMTERSVFWIVSCSKHSWNYLTKTLNAGEYFNDVIELNEISGVNMQELVLKRNQISGYQIAYEPTPQDLKNRKYLKLNETERQDFLRNRFFTQLNKFAKSNISLSLIYWVNSTSTVSQNTITIRSFRSLNFGFLHNLSIDKILVLLLIVLHSRIGLTELIEATSGKIGSPRETLQIMRQDGIIIEKASYYYLNPILFRHVVELLQIKNIIH